ncbi:hypothetical protein E2C01_074627 [Portunus trituberculatus]|uniref:Uncharacterized protein n=1 Tax=Portunus trituberculatus TaxID=210409 RepID=A0A5B7I8H9_PORTR|nr:hypothetical protein [Portunus trituberculatus]
MSREFHDSWGVCGHRREQQAPQEQQVCQGHVHLRHHGRGHCGGGHHHSDHLAQRVCHHSTGRARRQHLRKLRAPNCGPWTNTSHWGREVAESSEKCFQTMRHLLHMDDLAGAAACRYSSILARYDCRGSSSFLGARLTPHHSMCDLCQVRRPPPRPPHPYPSPLITHLSPLNVPLTTPLVVSLIHNALTTLRPHTHTHTHTHTYTHTHTVCVFLCVYVCMYVCMYICM